MLRPSHRPAKNASVPRQGYSQRTSTIINVDTHRFLSLLYQTPETFPDHTKLYVSLRMRSSQYLCNADLHSSKCGRRANHGDHICFGCQISRGQIPAGCRTCDSARGKGRGSWCTPYPRVTDTFVRSLASWLVKPTEATTFKNGSPVRDSNVMQTDFKGV